MAFHSRRNKYLNFLQFVTNMTSTVMATSLIVFSLFVFLGETGGGEGEMAFAQSTVATPANPIAVSSVTDGVTFDELNSARSITTVTIGSSTYALVASFFDDGVQIIDITNPATPTAISSVTDATASISSTFDVLDGANGITTVKIGSSTYALVASFNDSGVQIIDISTPASPTAVSSVIDGATFDELDSASGIATVKIGSSTYALVAAFLDDGVQIINITNPAAPTATSSITDGESDGSGGTFDELDGASDISIVQIGSDTYALVASQADDGVQIINITNPAAPTAVSSVTDGATFDELDGAYDITTVTIGQSIYALVASLTDDGIQIINITNPASPTATSSVTDGGTFDELDGANGITTVKIGSATYALVASQFDDGIQIINITNPATPTAVSSVTDGATFDELGGATGITTVQIGSSVYALVASQDDDGIQIIRIAEDQPEVATPTNPIAVSSITDGLDDGAGGTFDTLNGPRGITNVQIGTSTYVIVTGNLDHGIQIINMTNPAAPTAVFSIIDGSTDNSGVATYDTLRRAIDVTTVQIDAFTYALVTSNTDDGVQIIDITNPARPSVVSSIIDGGTDGNGDTFDELDGSFGIDTFTIGASTYAIVASLNDDGVQIINITDPKNPTATSSVTDGAGGFNTLDEATGITTVTRGASTYALVAANADDGIQIINITNPAVPTVAASITDGNGGFDELNGATGVTTVTIGAVTYALVTTSVDDAVQIINITNPSVPTAVSAVFDGGTDGTNTFDELNGASNITTIKVGSSTYALVASATDDGVQIIDITDPANPTVASSATHGGSDGSGGTFDGLDSARDVTTIQIDSSIYALVTARDVDAVQIIRIADNQPELEPEPEPLATPTNPMAVSSVTEGVGGFDELDGAFGISTIQIGSAIYAIVASNGDSGVQIINVSNPAVPTVSSSVTDGSTDSAGNTFDTLSRSLDVATVEINSSTYALATSSPDDGIQIINISNPAAPTVASSIIDSTTAVPSTFDELDGATSITTVKIGSATYALVASNNDDGVQIINITDPTNPTATSSVTDGAGGFNTLDGARGVTTIQIGSATYALVASNLDDGVQIINITDPATPTVTASITDGAGGFDRLDGATDIATVTIGQSIYALVTASVDNAVQIIDITNPATPTAVSAVFDGLSDGTNTFDRLDEATSVTTIKVGSSTYALVASAADNGVQIINITNPARPTVASSIFDGDVDNDGNTFTTLASARDVTTIRIGTEIYALVTSRDDDGVQIIRVASQADSDPAPKPAPNLGSASIESPLVASFLTDGVGGFTTLSTPGGITTVKIGSNTYALVTSLQDNSGGVQIIDITRPTAPILASEITVENSGANLDGANSITTIKIGSDTYALVASVFGNAVQILNISDPTAPTAVFTINDGGTFDTLRGASDITTVKMGPSTYALVTANVDHGVQIIDVSDPTAPTAVTSITDGSTFDTLREATSITTVKIGSDTYALVASRGDNGVQIINITDIANPTAVSSITSNENSFGTISVGEDTITTIKIGSAVYAILTSSPGDRVQIINITNPANPTFVSIINHNDVDSDGGTFGIFDGPTDVTTVTIAGTTYAIVVANVDNGIQIIDMSDPTMPTAVSSITQGDVDDNGITFNRLNGPLTITTVQIGTSLYALVASNQGSAGVQIIRIADDQPAPESESELATPENPIAVSSVFDGGSDGVGGTFDTLDESSNITTVTIGESTYALVTANGDNGVQIIDITNPAAPIATSSITDGVGGFDVLFGTSDITTFQVGSSTYGIVVAAEDDGIQIINITNPAAPTAVTSVIDGSTFDTLDGASDIAITTIGQSTYALVTASNDNGIQIIDITDIRNPTAVTSITNDDTDGNGGTFDTLDGPIEISIVQIDFSIYALVTAFTDDGIQIIDISNPAAPTAVASISDGDTDGNGDTFDTLDGPRGVTTVKIGLSTYALVTASDDNGIQIIDITDPVSPTAVTSISDGDSDGSDTFDELDGANRLTTVTVGESTYALVTSFVDDGIQIINITDIENPTAASSITDDGTFNALNDPAGITTVQIGSSIYAISASSGDDGIQIIRIAEDQSEFGILDEYLANPIITAYSIIDGTSDSVGNTFGTLGSPRGITTIQIGSSIYALATSNNDDGIQIIDITDPQDPLVVSSAINGANSFDKLDKARDITTIRIGSSTYALVTAGVSDQSGIQIIDVTNPSTPTAVSSVIDGGTDGASGTFDTLRDSAGITTVRINLSTYAIVASSGDDGIQIIDITDPAVPTAVSSVTDGSTDGASGTFDELLGASDVTTIRMGNSIYALVTAGLDDGVQIIDISDPAAPTAVSSVTDGVGGFSTLDGAFGIDTVVISDFDLIDPTKTVQLTYALVTANVDDGVQVINISDPTSPVAVSSIGGDDPVIIIGGGSNVSTDRLDGANGISTFSINSTTYAIVTSDMDDSIQIIEVRDAFFQPTITSLTDYVDDGTLDDIPNANTFDTLDGASGVTTVKIGTATYALVAASDDDGIQIIRMTQPVPEASTFIPSSGGSSSDWKKKPTFGKSWEVSSDQLVKNGFSFNGYSLDITDNWHTDFVKTSTIIGEINHVQMKVFAFDGLKYVQLSLGLPEIGATSDAEADIIVHLERNYDNPDDYDVVGIEHEQTEPLVNTDSTTASITPSLCNTSHTEPFCYTIDIEFAVDAPLSHDVIAISAIDTKRRTTTTHINDGVEFLGESLLPAETASIFIKKTNQGKGNHLILTQDDRRYDTWTDQDGYQWMQNSYGTWIQQTLPDMIISHDGSTQVMTRLHSEFDSMVQQEQERAILVFDSKNIQSVLDEPFSYEFHEIIPRHLDEGLLEKMELEEILALEKMLNIYIYDDNWSEVDDDDDDE